jgi:hypothetical protein
MPTSSRRDSTPSVSWSTSSCWAGVGLRGRKADMSAL